MRSKDERPESLESDSYRELRLLEEVDGSANLSQRQISRNLGIALGVANLLVRTMAKKGYIKVSKVSWKRWAYVVTPAGMTRKISLTIAYVERFVQHYRNVRQLLRKEISSLPLNSDSRVAIVGASELAELAYLALKDIGVENIEVFEREVTRSRFLGMSVQRLDTMQPGHYTRIVVCDFGAANGFLDRLDGTGGSRSHVVELLRADRGKPDASRHVDGASASVERDDTDGARGGVGQ